MDRKQPRTSACQSYVFDCEVVDRQPGQFVMKIYHVAVVRRTQLVAFTHDPLPVLKIIAYIASGNDVCSKHNAVLFTARESCA